MYSEFLLIGHHSLFKNVVDLQVNWIFINTYINYFYYIGVGICGRLEGFVDKVIAD